VEAEVEAVQLLGLALAVLQLSRSVLLEHLLSLLLEWVCSADWTTCKCGFFFGRKTRLIRGFVPSEEFIVFLV
jgi:hypothetical protein